MEEILRTSLLGLFFGTFGTTLGGIIGIILGVLIIKYVVGAIDKLTPVYSKEWIIAAFTISVSIGVIFGLFPANKAASLNPIEALRNE